jgi:hypothetical protein
MKHLKLFESFNLIQEGNIDFYETEEIFFPMENYGLKASDIFASHFLSMGGKDVIEDHKELSRPVMAGIAVRLNPDETFTQRKSISDNFFNDLRDCISHFESRCECKLVNIYFRTPGGCWFSSVDVLSNFLSSHIDFRLLAFIDIAFKFNDSIKTFQTTDETGNIRSINNTKSLFDN